MVSSYSIAQQGECLWELSFGKYGSNISVRCFYCFYFWLITTHLFYILLKALLFLSFVVK